MQILPLPLEPGIGIHMNPQVQITRLGAARALFALARHTYARPFGDTRGNSHVDGARVAIVLQRQPPGRALVRVVQREIDAVLDVAALLSTRRAAARAASSPAAPGLAAPGEERAEKI